MHGGYAQACRFDRVSARFIRLALAAPSTEQGRSIDEIVVYGEPA